ncbi:MAG: hypothetical protein D6B28_03045 [Gammaproteobacteria bacterium]|nr:MAG: hypothetical protein D6B28_03045 [Gammaproteobacteria bacterium]
MKKLLNILLTVSIFLYPLLVYFGLQHFDVRVVAVFILVILALRYVASNRSSDARHSLPQFRLVLIFGILLVIGTLVTNSEYGIKLYPALVSAGMLVIFASSLYWPPPIIERFARLMDKNFPDEAIPYTRKVTIAWCLFFIINGLIALWTTFFASQEMWVTYNGLISYILIGLMFAVEFVIRKIVMRKNSPELKNNSELDTAMKATKTETE